MRALWLGNCRLLSELLWEMYFRGQKQSLPQQKRVTWMKRLLWSWRDEAEHIVCVCEWEIVKPLEQMCLFSLFELVLRLGNCTFYQNPHIATHAAILLSHFCRLFAGFDVLLYTVKWICVRMNWDFPFVYHFLSRLIPSECSSFLSLWLQSSRFGSPVLGFPCRMIYLGCVRVFQRSTSQSLALMSFSFLIPLHLSVLALYCSRFCSNTLLKETDQWEETAELKSRRMG